MGRSLNPGNDLFQMSLNSQIYVDKSELIAQHRGDGAVQEHGYESVFEGWDGEILLVAIAYDSATKEHACLIEKR